MCVQKDNTVQPRLLSL